MSENAPLRRAQPSQSNNDDMIMTSNAEFPAIVVYSADDIPKKVTKVSSSTMVESKEDKNYSTGRRMSLTLEGCEEEMPQQDFSNGTDDEALPDELMSLPSGQRLSVQNVTSDDDAQEIVELDSNSSQTSVGKNVDEKSTIKKGQGENGSEHTTGSKSKKLVTTSLADSIKCEPDVTDVEDVGSKPNDRVQSRHQCCDLEDDVFLPDSDGRGTSPKVSTDVLSSHNSTTTASENGSSVHPPVDRAMTSQESMPVQPVNQRTRPKEAALGKSVPRTLSSLISSSSAMFSDSTKQVRPMKDSDNTSELSFKFGSSLSLRTLGRYNEGF